MFPQSRVQELQKSIDKMIIDPNYHEDRSFTDQQFLPTVIKVYDKEPYFMIDEPCQACNGRGKYPTFDECAYCYGTGTFVRWIYAGKLPEKERYTKLF
jgi:RecJ-like exonuclease